MAAMADSVGKTQGLARLKGSADLDHCLDIGYALFKTFRNVETPPATFHFQEEMVDPVRLASSPVKAPGSDLRLATEPAASEDQYWPGHTSGV
jgi:hypothetical protein